MVGKGKAQYIAAFKKLHKAKTGNELDDAQALELFESLIVLVRAVYKPIPMQEIEKQHGQTATN